MSTPDLPALLTSKFNYQADEAAEVAANLSNMPREWLGRFSEYLKTGDLPTDPEIRGVNVDLLSKSWGMLPPAAFLTMAWIEENPEEALRVLHTQYDKIMLVD